MPTYPNDAIALKDQIALVLSALAFVFSIFTFSLNYKRGSLGCRREPKACIGIRI